jgi:hypothetical protein
MLDRVLPIVLSSLALAGGVVAASSCADEPTGVGHLNIASADPLTPAAGETVTITVRAVMLDGTSIDVTDRAVCALDAKDPPGTFAGRVFTAAKSGTANVVCTFAGASGSLGITVPGPQQVTVASVQKGTYPQGSVLELAVVVFGIDPDAQYTNFWAQDPGGGPMSGIYFRDVRKLVADAGATPAPVAEGDTVTVSGAYAERDGRSIINWTAVSRSGTAKPKADIVALSAIDPATWDGCLVEVDDVVVVNPAFDAYTWQVSEARDPTAGAKLLVETLLYALTPPQGQVYGAIVGPLYVLQPKSGGSLEVAIAPRRATDLTAKP